eukprot:jgi/Tetstr1/425840/TSEL_016217.t1
MRQIVEKKMLEARVVAPTQNISHKLADVHDFPAVKAFLENVDKEISDRNKLWVPETEAWLGRRSRPILSRLTPTNLCSTAMSF